MPADPTPPGLPPADRPRPARVHAPRLPGTYAANFERDMDWRRGVAILWVLFLLIALGEMLLAVFILLQGQLMYPTPLDAVRLCVEGALFVALWLGWGWLRWPLAALNFSYGAWQIIWLLTAHAARPVGPDAPVGWGIESIPTLAIAIVYLASACYLAFSADVLDFLRHRREEGRGWVVAPLVLTVGVYLVMLLNAPFSFHHWLDLEKASAQAFVTQSLGTISTRHWDVAAYENLADPAYLKTWYEGDRKNVFAGLSRLGEFRRASDASTVGGVAEDATHSGFVLGMQCTFGRVEFAHGSTRMTWTVTKTLFGPWKLQGFNAGQPKFDTASTPASH